ncbi:hypothetical protein EW146_g5392 [Bondarzewia mesenterica]|uniref:ABC transmembrane type-1 domain-containing protein n=1 Tax=Bondarzewia mesenterica TaxID=1095465 RepID=A0A4S4LXF6_9AGAM|nr:hypothetical protein EW146_g5392 [Bondarzewia mesenterica]
MFLVLRTVLSVGVAKLDGRIVRDLVSANGKGFLCGLGLWFLLAVPSIYTNSMIHHLQSNLLLCLCTKLTHYTHDLYLSSEPYLHYYCVYNEGGLEGVDQYITVDIASWSDSISGLYGNLLKPLLDLTLFTSQLSCMLSVRGTVALFVNYYVMAKILRMVTLAFGRLVAMEARLEGEYRAEVGRVGREGEEIAFYNGGTRERNILWRAYLRLIKHVNSIIKIRIAYEWTEDYMIKYLWSAVGYCLISIPILFTPRWSLGVQTRAKMVITDDTVANQTESSLHILVPPAALTCGRRRSPDVCLQKSADPAPVSDIRTILSTTDTSTDWTEPARARWGEEPTNYWSQSINIDGRDEEEENNWWNAAVHKKHRCPGSGILPPLLADKLHNSLHSLFSVSVLPPHIKIPSFPPSTLSFSSSSPLIASGSTAVHSADR